MGELALVGDHSTVPLTRISCNTVFFKSQKTRKVGTLPESEIDKLITYLFCYTKISKSLDQAKLVPVVLVSDIANNHNTQNQLHIKM